MAHVEKYYHQFCNPSGQICRISIQKRGYAGSSIELEGQPDPITITYDNSDEFKFKAIIPSTADIFLTFGTGNGVDFSDFWEADEKTFKIVYTISGQIEWAGFVMLEGFAYELSGGVYYAQITATDGLGTLESILFKDDNTGQKYGLTDLTYNNGFQFPFVLIATEILRKLDLDLDLWTLVDVYEQNQTDRTSDSRDSDPLAITYANVKTYINGTKRNDIPYYQEVDEAWDCKKVMENLLNVMCGSQLFQENGVWKIKRMGVDAKYGIDNPIKLNDNIYLHQASYTDGLNQTALTVKDYIFDENLNLYSSSETYANGDLVSNEEGGATAQDGYYKIKGAGKIIRVISNEIRGVITYDAPVYKWHKYNTLSAYLGNEELNNEVFVPCKDVDTYLLGDDHILRMDNLLKQFRVNYEYSYIKDGDSPDNLIKNGNFTQDYDQYGGVEAPPYWNRIKWNNNWLWALRTDEVQLTERIEAFGYSRMLNMGKQFNDLNTNGKLVKSAPFSAIGQSGIVVSNTEDEHRLTVVCKYKYKSNGVTYLPCFRLFLVGQTRCGFLINENNEKDKNYDTEWRFGYKKDLVANIYSPFIPNQLKVPKISLNYFSTNNSWQEALAYEEYDVLTLDAKNADNYDENEEGAEKWYKFSISVPPFVEVGELIFYNYGLVTPTRKPSNAFKSDSYNFFGRGSDGHIWRYYGLDSYQPFYIASLNIGAVPTEGEEIPSEDYIYANENINYNDQTDPIEIFNGDTEDVVVQSSLIVPANNTDKKNKWDTSDNDFGKSDLGLILCKSVMNQYGHPSKLLEGNVKVDNATYGTRFKFEAIPNSSFILLRGKFNPIRGYIEDATFAEISNVAIKRGGVINGESLDPVWTNTRNIRCVKANNENTGYYEEEQQDTNRNSETYGTIRWVLGQEDTQRCPIGEPSKYYWGCDDANYQLSNFKDYTYIEESGVVSVDYTQEGGKYIYFLHLASLGTVNRVANGFQYNIIDSFQYLADVTINGYLYRVLRQEFVTARMDEFQQIFDFN